MHESIVHWSGGLCLEYHPACLRTKLLAYFGIFVRAYVDTDDTGYQNACLFFMRGWGLIKGFSHHGICDKSACHSEENIPWASMIRDMMGIDISSPIPPHYGHLQKSHLFIGCSARKGRRKVMKIFKRAENDTGGKTIANRGVQNVALPPPAIW